MVDKKIMNLIAFVLVPLIFVFCYLATELYLNGYRPSGSIVILLSLMISSSLIWIPAGFLFTIVFGGFVIGYFLKPFYHKRLLRRTLLVPPKEELEKISKEPAKLESRPGVILKIFVLVFAVNFIYAIFVTTNGWAPKTGSPTKIFFETEAIAGLFFLPLITMVIPLYVGKFKIRQVDNSPIDAYWLYLIIMIAGGASAALLFVQRSALNTIIPPLFLFAVCAWWAALGALLALPRAQRILSRRLLRMRDDERIIFGKMWAGASKEKAREV